MSTATKIVTAEELFRMPGSAHRLELIDGELRQMTPAGSVHGFLTVEISSLLREHVRRHKLGGVVGAETGFRIGSGPDTVLAPDVAFIRRERLAVTGIPKAYYPEAPALVVEVVSPGDTAEEVDDKIRRWFAAGVELAWVVYPTGRTVTVYRGLDDIRVLSEKDVLEGDSVVSGFNCRVGDLFAVLDPQ
jgi:Uma2 family endonuclease